MVFSDGCHGDHVAMSNYPGSLRDVVCLQSQTSLQIFQDLLNFDDPLNLEAAEHYQRDKVSEI